MKLKLMNYVLLAILALTLIGCGGKTDAGTTPGGNDDGDVEALFDISGLKGTVEFDEDGKPLFEEEIQLKVWSVIGDPDQIVFQRMVDKFNEEFLGMIHLNVVYQGHFDYYTALDSAYAADFEDAFPDVCFMHNEKTVEYAYKNYFYPLDTLFESTGVNMDLSQIYPNIDRTTIYRDHRFGIPVDAHGFVTQFRQDIIKKNELGFDGNTRFIPQNAAEYQQLLQGLRTKADNGELLIRNINKGQDHSWHVANKNTFYPSFTQSTDPDGLSALYANGGSLANAAQDKITFHQNAGFKKYVTDQVERWNNRLIGESGTAVEMFGLGNTVMFSEGPWWVSQTYSFSWNSAELSQAQNGVSAEEAADPVYNQPYTASRPQGWWTTEENATSENAGKWYGNGHVITLTRHIDSMQKAAAALTFAQWYTQSMDKGNYNLQTWCASGHIPAWKNVYESEGYKTLLNTNMTLRALGNPADILTLEGLEYATVTVSGLQSAVFEVQSQLKSVNGCTKEQALSLIETIAGSTQSSLDLLKMGF